MPSLEAIDINDIKEGSKLDFCSYYSLLIGLKHLFFYIFFFRIVFFFSAALTWKLFSTDWTAAAWFLHLNLPLRKKERDMVCLLFSFFGKLKKKEIRRRGCPGDSTAHLERGRMKNKQTFTDNFADNTPKYHHEDEEYSI